MLGDDVYSCYFSETYESHNREITNITDVHNPFEIPPEVIVIRGAKIIHNDDVKVVPRGFERFYPSLEVLEISDSRISSVAKEDFENLKLLKVLLLNGNRIRRIPSDLFNGSSELIA